MDGGSPKTQSLMKLIVFAEISNCHSIEMYVNLNLFTLIDCMQARTPSRRTASEATLNVRAIPAPL